MSDDKLLTLRVAGLGHKLTFDMKPAATIGEVKAEIQRQTSLPAAYQRLIVHGKKLDNGSLSLSDAAIQHRTRIMLLHNEMYAADREGVEAITTLLQEMDELESNNSLQPEAVHELITLICCKLDAIDTHGSETLRAMRKEALQRAEAISKK